MDRRLQILDASKPIAVGVAGAAILLALYFSILTWSSNFDYAFEQFEGSWYWITSLATGFGIQLALFTYIKIHIRRKITGVAVEVAASGGISTGSMLVCCAHYLTNVVPLLGMSAVAIFLTKYQTSFLVLGVFSNITGVTFLLYFAQKHGVMPHLFSSKTIANCNMRAVRNATVFLSVAIVSLSFYFAAFKQ